MTWARHLREHGLVEIICTHGVGHPSIRLTPVRFYDGTHGCDGCCLNPEFAIAESRMLQHPACRRLTIHPNGDKVIE